MNRFACPGSSNLITPYEELYSKNCLIVNHDINNYDNVDFRIDNYNIQDILCYDDISYRDFLYLLIPNIKEYILKFVSCGDIPIKLTFLLYKDNNKKKIKRFRPFLTIYFPETKNVEINLLEKIQSSINSECYTPYDRIYPSDGYNTLTIIQEKLTIPPDESDDDSFDLPSEKNLSKTFKEDKCVICLDSKPDILFCNCGNLVVCEECFNKLYNNKCPKCKVNNEIIRKI